MPSTRTAALGKRLETLRKKMKWTREDLSKRIGVSKQTLYTWEKRKAFPRDAYLSRLARFLRQPAAKLSRLKKNGHDLRWKLRVASHKDPVVSALSPRFVPVIGAGTRVLSMDDIRHPENWMGKCCVLPPDFFPGNLFGFEIGDRSMEPLYSPGQTVLVDMKAEVRASRAMVIKVRGQDAKCRFVIREGSSVLLKSLNAGEERISKKQVEWGYAVAAVLGGRPSAGR